VPPLRFIPARKGVFDQSLILLYIILRRRVCENLSEYCLSTQVVRLSPWESPLLLPLSVKIIMYLRKVCKGNMMVTPQWAYPLCYRSLASQRTVRKLRDTELNRNTRWEGSRLALPQTSPSAPNSPIPKGANY